jgi:hypothetical protein
VDTNPIERHAALRAFVEDGEIASQVDAAGRRCLSALVEPALARLERILKTGNDRDALRAIQFILDRCGVGLTSESSTGCAPAHPTESHGGIGVIETDHLTDEQLANARRFTQRLRDAVPKAPQQSDAKLR